MFMVSFWPWAGHSSANIGKVIGKTNYDFTYEVMGSELTVITQMQEPELIKNDFMKATVA